MTIEHRDSPQPWQDTDYTSALYLLAQMQLGGAEYRDVFTGRPTLLPSGGSLLRAWFDAESWSPWKRAEPHAYLSPFVAL